MKPGDHPDFYRFPAPAGRSRESTIRLDAEGRFFHDGAPVEHPGLHRAFASWVRVHPDDGRYILSNDYDWCYFTVDHTPLFISGVRVEPDGVILRLFDGTDAALDPDSLAVDEEGHLHCRVRGLPARFQRAAQLQMEPLLDDEGEAVLIGANRYPLVQRSARG